MNCPIDQTPLLSQLYEGDIGVERCSSCEGIWLTKDKLFAIERLQENDYREQIEEPRTSSERMQFTSSVEKPRELSCPSCQSPMYEHEHGYFSGVLIDTCIACGGVWLDKGELAELEIFFEKNRTGPESFWEAFQQGMRSLFGIQS